MRPFSRYAHCGFSPLGMSGVAQFGKGGGGGGQQTSTSTVQLPSWVNDHAMANVGSADTVAANLQPTAIAPVAPMPSGLLAAIGGLQGAVGSSTPGFTQALSTLNGLQGFTPQSVSAGQLSSTDLAPYMNPYTQDVINATLPLMEQQRKIALQGVDDAARGAGAFGGSRQGVAEGVTNAQYGLNEGQMAAGLNAQNFQQAQAAAGQDIGTRLGAAIQNQNAGLQGAGLNLNAASNGASVAGNEQTSLLGSLMADLQGQSLLQQQQQNVNQQAADVANAQNQQPVNALQIKTGTLAATPYGQTTTSQTSLPAGNSTMQGLGAGLGILGSLGGLFGASGAFPLVGASSILR